MVKNITRRVLKWCIYILVCICYVMIYSVRSCYIFQLFICCLRSRKVIFTVNFIILAPNSLWKKKYPDSSGESLQLVLKQRWCLLFREMFKSYPLSMFHGQTIPNTGMVDDFKVEKTGGVNILLINCPFLTSFDASLLFNKFLVNDGR